MFAPSLSSIKKRPLRYLHCTEGGTRGATHQFSIYSSLFFLNGRIPGKLILSGRGNLPPARAIRAYERAGFVREGVLRDAIATSGGFADDVLMSMLESEWRARQTYSDTRC